MLATKLLTSSSSCLLRCCSCTLGGPSVDAVFHQVAIRGTKGGAQGDGTKHKKIRNKTPTYAEIPRIPGVTFMPEADSMAEVVPGGLVKNAEDQELSAVSSHNNPIAPAPAINPEFFNRNPRNMEMMNLAMRRSGWKLEAERKDHYNKIVFERTPYHTRASIVHTSGRVIVSASTEEFGISKFLYRTTDISAAKNIGAVLGRRMLETGIMAAYCGLSPEEREGKRMVVFLQALTDSGIQLQEEDRIITRNLYGGKDARHLKGSYFPNPPPSPS